MSDIIFALSALSIAGVSYWISRSAGYASGVDAGYDHGWLDGSRAGRRKRRREI